MNGRSEVVIWLVAGLGEVKIRLTRVGGCSSHRDRWFRAN